MVSQAHVFKRGTLATISHLLSCLPKSNKPIGRFRILLYHSVDEELPNDSYGMNVTPKSFRSQMQFLQTADHIEVTALDAVQHITERSRKIRVIITFDDGFRNNLYKAAPVLLEFGFPFVVFVTIDLLRSGDRRYLNSEELQKLSRMPGATIGSHGMTHRPLSHLSMTTLTSELVQSKEVLEQITGREISAISYPHGKYNRKVKDAALNATYQMGVCSRFGANQSGTDVMCLRRTEIWGTDRVGDVSRKIDGDWDWYAVYQRFKGL